MIDKTKWIVVENKFFTASGHNEIVAAFMFKYEAEGWLGIGRRDPTRYSILRREEKS